MFWHFFFRRDYFSIVDCVAPLACSNFRNALKANDRLKFAQDMASNNIREKGKLWYKLSYKVLKEENRYDLLFDISPYLTFIKLKYFLGWIHHCVLVVGMWIFDSNVPFELPITKENLYYCCIRDNDTKLLIFYKGVSKAIRFSQNRMINFPQK